MGERTLHNLKFTTRQEPLRCSMCCVCCVLCGRKFHAAPSSHSQISPFSAGRFPFTPAPSPMHSVRSVGWVARSLARSRLRQCPRSWSIHRNFPNSRPNPSLPRLPPALPRLASTAPRKAADHGMTIRLPFPSLSSIFSMG